MTTGHLARLALRATAPATGLRPRTPSLFEPPARMPSPGGEEYGARPPEAPPVPEPAAVEPARTAAAEPGFPATSPSAPGSAEPTLSRHRGRRPTGSRRGPWAPGEPQTTSAHPPLTTGTVKVGPAAGLHSTGEPPGPAPADVPGPSRHEDSTIAPGPGRAEPAAHRPTGTTPPPVPPPRAAWTADRPEPARPAGEEVTATHERPTEPLPRLNLPGRPDPAPAHPEVTVTIGRIEVLPPAADRPAPAPSRQRRPATAPDLGDYLRDRSRDRSRP